MITSCPSPLDIADVRKCEKFGCRDRAICYHVYYYCAKHCPAVGRGK